jgi:predicted transposase YbfD/YdcC
VDPVEVDSLADAFAMVSDPRDRRGRWHPLITILLIAACAVTCDANGFTAVFQWVADAPPRVLARLRVRRDPFTGRYRPPSEKTIRRTVALVNPHELEQAVGAFVAARITAAGLTGPVGSPVKERQTRQARERPARAPAACARRRLAADGKALRGARRDAGGRVMLLGLADHDTAAVIAQRQIAAKSNEIPELRHLVAGMNLTGCLITADAAHCHADTATAIIAAGGDYLLTVKANQPTLLNAITPLLTGTDTTWANRQHTSTDRGHGRTEQRTVRLSTADGVDFPHAAQVFRTVRYTGGLDGQRTTKQVVFGITSLPADQAGPDQIAADQRGHWSIENTIHHVRDTTFDEDRCQVRTAHAPRNLATLRNLAIGTFRAEGHANIAHARRHHTHDHERVLNLYRLHHDTG